MRNALLLCTLLAAACTDFDTLDRGVCGNGLIEPGEDCDSSDPSCVRCAVTCDKQVDCPGTAYACGTDGLCHAPGGTLAPPLAAGPFQVNDFQITDIGGDGTGDVVGSSRTSIVVKPGDPTGQLGKGTSIVTPFQTGHTAFGDLDGDGSLDLTMMTPDGLVSYTSPLGELTPLPVQSSIGGNDAGLELIGLYRVSNYALGAFLASPDDKLLIAAFDLGNSGNDAVVLPCGLNFKASAFGESSYDVNRLSADTDLANELIFAITGPTLSGGVRTCVMSIAKTTTTAAAITDITPVAAQTGNMGKPVMLDLDFDADKCPGLMTQTTTGAFRYYDGSRQGAACALSATGTNFVPKDATPDATLVGRFPLSPPIPLAANDVLVMSDGIQALSIAGPFKIYSSPRRIGRAEYGDINGDGIVDGIVASDSEDDIDVLLRTQDPGYQLVRLDTASRITSLTIGDYDGNGIEDIAYTELLDAYQRLEVSFSTTDRPLDPVAVGAFPNNISIVRLQVPDSLDPQGLATDLAVLTLRTGMRPPSVTLLHGSSQRTLLPYFDPTPAGSSSIKTHQFRGAVVGNFAGGDTLPDIAGIGVPVQHPDNTSTTPIKAWVMKGTAVGPDGSETLGRPLSGIADCAKPNQTGLCANDAFYLRWKRTDHDVALVFDKTGAVGMVDPASVNSPLPVSAPPDDVSAPTLGFRDAFASDLDGDKQEDVVMVWGKPDASAWKMLVCTNAGGNWSCVDHAAGLTAIEGIETCVDAAPGRIRYRDPFTTDGGDEDVIVLCRGGDSSMLIRIGKNDAGYTYDELIRVPEVLDAIRVGDVTGDGVDDIAALANDHGAETLEVFRQCSSRDANVCRGGGK